MDSVSSALGEVESLLTPVAQDDDPVAVELLNEVSAFVKLVGGGWPDAQRQEFQDQAVMDLAGYPGHLVIPAVRDARFEIALARQFVPHVVSVIRDAHVRLTAEAANYRKLLDIGAMEAA